MSASAPIPELQRVVLTQDLPEHFLEAGDVGTVVDRAPGNQRYLVEFLNLSGDTVAVAAVTPNQVRPIERTEVTHARRRAG